MLLHNVILGAISSTSFRQKWWETVWPFRNVCRTFSSVCVCVSMCVCVCVCVHQIIEMIKEIQEVFINNLEQLTWMDRQTKEAAKQKVLATKPVNVICAIVFGLRIIDENICIFSPFAFLRPKPSGNKSAMMTKFWMMNTSTASTVMYDGFSSSTLLTGSTEAVTKKQVICCCCFF